MPKTKLHTEIFSESELITILEVAREALQDADIFDSMASRLDIRDSDMIVLRAKLEAVMRR